MAANDSPWERNFVVQMQRLREMRAMTQTDLARALSRMYGLKFHQQTIQRIENGERPVKLNEAYLIAKVLNVSLDVMTESGTPSDHEVHFAVDQLRNRSEVAITAIREVRDEWAEAIVWLAADLMERHKTGHDLQDDLVALWGHEWLSRTFEPYANLEDAMECLAGISGQEEEVETLAGHDEVDRIRAWQSDPRIEETLRATRFPLGANQLFREFPGEPEAASRAEIRHALFAGTEGASDRETR